MSNISTQELAYSDKCLSLLNRKDFMSILDFQNLDIIEFNALVLAHITTVVAQSQGVKSLKLDFQFVKIIASMDKNATLDIPIPKCTFRIDLTNKGYITPTSYTGSKITVWHKNDFDFYRSSHLNKWMNNQIRMLKSFSTPVDLPNIKINIDKYPKTKENREKENDLVIYKQVVDTQPLIKKLLNFYFLSQTFETNTSSSSKKVKL